MNKTKKSLETVWYTENIKENNKKEIEKIEKTEITPRKAINIMFDCWNELAELRQKTNRKPYNHNKVVTMAELEFLVREEERKTKNNYVL